MREQYPLDLPHNPTYAAADFLAADCNGAARALIEAWRGWPAGAAAIWGVPGAGKTHLAHVWGRAVDAKLLDAAGFRALDLAALEPPRRFVLDMGAESLAAGDETPLFHLLNLVRECRGALLIVARQAPARWPVALADLRSRLRAAPAAEVAAPDDGLFAALLAKQFADRQLVVDDETIGYLTLRAERSFEAARTIVARIDRAALARRRKINKWFAGEVLAEIEAENR